MVRSDDSRIKKLKCLVYDFDGVMTDNRVLVDETGRESVFVNRSDGLAVSMIKKMGIQQAILSTEDSILVRWRAEKLNIDAFYGISDKGEALRQYCRERKFDLEEVMFIGNDLNDLPAMKIAGIKGAPADAAKEVLEIADWISVKNGGYGVIRNLYDELERGLNNRI